MNASLSSTAHVWLTGTSGDAPRRPDWLDETELQRMQRLRRDADRDRYLVAHTHLRSTLSRYGAAHPADWQFRIGDHGRPELAPEVCLPGLQFNLSRSDGLVACIVARGAHCGVDVEVEGAVAEPALVAAAIGSSTERLLQGWTRREAYVKASGGKMATHLTGQALDAPGWHFTHQMPTANHHLATAVRPYRSVELHWA